MRILQDTLDQYAYDDENRYLYTIGDMKYLIVSDFGDYSRPEVSRISVNLGDQLDGKVSALEVNMHHLL